MNIFFWKKQQSVVQMFIEGLRPNMNTYRQLEAADKEKIAESVRAVWVIHANEAEQISKIDPRAGKKLRRQSEKDEAELNRFLVELGVGRYSPENQQKIDEIQKQCDLLVEKVRNATLK